MTGRRYLSRDRPAEELNGLRCSCLLLLPPPQWCFC